MTGNLSKIIHLPKNLRKVGYLLRLSLVSDNHCHNPVCQSYGNHSSLLRFKKLIKFSGRTYIHDLYPLIQDQPQSSSLLNQE